LCLRCFNDRFLRVVAFIFCHRWTPRVSATIAHLFPSLPVLVVPRLNKVALAVGAFRVLETM
jgi:hypothetical protein